MNSGPRVLAVDHVQLAMPAGGEEAAERFYGGVLGFAALEKPAGLRGRGGCWFRSHDVDLHLGVDPRFTPAEKAHPAFLVDNLSALAERIREAGGQVVIDTQLEGFRRFYCADPFGNRLEFLERIDPAVGRASGG